MNYAHCAMSGGPGLDAARQGRRGLAKPGVARQGKAGKERPGPARPGQAWQGFAGKASCGLAGQRMLWRCQAGVAVLGSLWQALAGLDMATQVRIGVVRRGGVWYGLALLLFERNRMGGLI